jgi:hypothetical protein
LRTLIPVILVPAGQEEGAAFAEAPEEAAGAPAERKEEVEKGAGRTALSLVAGRRLRRRQVQDMAKSI